MGVISCYRELMTLSWIYTVYREIRYISSMYIIEKGDNFAIFYLIIRLVHGDTVITFFIWCMTTIESIYREIYIKKHAVVIEYYLSSRRNCYICNKDGQ